MIKWLSITHNWLLYLCIFTVVGNKLDIVSDDDSDRRQVTTQEAMEYAELINVDFIEVSALSGQYVDQFFRRVIFSVARLIPDVQTQLELNFLPLGWLAAVQSTDIPFERQDSNDSSRSNSIVSQSPQYPAVALTSTGSFTAHGTASVTPASSDFLGNEDVRIDRFSTNRLKSMKRKSVSSSSIESVMKFTYINYWDGSTTTVTPTMPAPLCLLYTAKDRRNITKQSSVTNSE